MYLHRIGIKVMSDQGENYQQNLQEKIVWSRLVYLRRGDVESSYFHQQSNNALSVSAAEEPKNKLLKLPRDRIDTS